MLVAQGTATLTNGSVTVSHPHIRSTCRIFLTRLSSFGAIGDLKLGAEPTNGAFTIASANLLDNSTVYWKAIA